MNNQNQQDAWAQHEITALRTSQRWATLGIIIVVLLAAAGLVWGVDFYFGAGGVRVFLIAVGILSIVVVIYALSIGVSAVYGRQAMAHHDNVLSGLIQFQRADDYGEVARQVATGMSGAMRSGNTLDARVLTIANQIAKQQQAQLTDSQRTAQPPAGWAMIEDDQIDAGQFRHID